MERICEIDIHTCSSSDCEVYEPCGKPAVEGTPFCAEHQDIGVYYRLRTAAKRGELVGLYRRMRTLIKLGKIEIN